jgi:hypothetical protein
MSKTYARIEAGMVVELLRTDADPALLFHPALRWVDTLAAPVEIGWVETEAGLRPPPPVPPAPAAAPVPTLAELHAQLSELAAKVAALTPR